MPPPTLGWWTSPIAWPRVRQPDPRGKGGSRRRCRILVLQPDGGTHGRQASARRRTRRPRPARRGVRQRRRRLEGCRDHRRGGGDDRGAGVDGTGLDARLDPGRVDLPGQPTGDGPQRIVSLSSTATEMLFAIGAGSQVVAVDDQSNYPAEAAAVKTDLSGLPTERRGHRRLRPGPRRDLRHRRPQDAAGRARAQGLGRPGGVHVRRHLRPDRTARRGHRSRRRSRPAGRRDAARPRQAGGRRTGIAAAAEGLPRARRHRLHGGVQHVHRSGVRHVRPQQHRRRRRRSVRLPAAERRDDHPGRPGTDLPRRHQVLRAEPRDAQGPTRLGRHQRRSRTATCSRWTTTSPRARGPRVVEYAQQVHDALQQVAVPTG